MQRRSLIARVGGPGLALLVFSLLPMRAAAVPVDADAVCRVATRFVQSHFADHGEVEATCGQVPALGAAAGADAEIRPQFLRAPGARGPVVVRLDFWQGERRVGQTAVTVHVRVFADVVVAARALDRHDVVERAALKLERRDLRASSQPHFTSVREVLGQRAVRSVRVGEPLVARSVESVPAIRRGDRITIRVDASGVTVSVTGTALEDGSVGREIAVRNDRSGHRMQAVVLAEGLARVRLGGRVTER